MNPIFPVPRIVVSRCLGFAVCRYDGQPLKNDFVEQLQPYAEMLPVCPEVECGLGIPRSPIRLCQTDNGIVVYQPATGKDITAQLQATTNALLAALPEIDGAILKSRSPSCGLYDTKIFQGIDDPQLLKQASGIFGAQVLENSADLAVEDEMRLTDLSLRQHFLIKLFTLARFRELSKQPEMGGLVDFHATHKLLLLAYNQRRFRLAGTIAANHAKLPPAEAFRLYRDELFRILDAPFRVPAVINTLYHAYGWIAEHLGSKNKHDIINAMEEYRDQRLPLHTLTRLLGDHALRCNHSYLRSQVFLQPYPQELDAFSDSDRNRTVT